MSARIVPTLIDLPSELRGSRVLLRPYLGGDAEQVFAAIDASRDHLRPWVTWVDNNRTVDDVRDYCIRSQASWLLRTELALGTLVWPAVSTSGEPGCMIRIGNCVLSRSGIGFA